MSAPSGFGQTAAQIRLADRGPFLPVKATTLLSTLTRVPRRHFLPPICFSARRFP